MKPQATVPETIMLPWTTLSKSSVREKRAYHIGNDVRVYWFDPWTSAKFIPCGILSREQLRAVML